MIAICLRGYNALTPVLVLMKYIYLVPLDTLTLTSVRPAHQDITGNWYLVVVSREGILVSCVLSRRPESEFSQRVIFAFWGREIRKSMRWSFFINFPDIPSFPPLTLPVCHFGTINHEAFVRSIIVTRGSCITNFESVGGEVFV